MHVRELLRPPRHLLLIFLGTTLVLASTVGWFGWRLLRQDRALAAQRVQERLENSADLIANLLAQKLDEIDTALADLATREPEDLSNAGSRYATELADDAVVVSLSVDGVVAFPAGRLVYYPNRPPVLEPSPNTFVRGESLELRSRDYAAAAETYDRLSRSTDQVVRAGAMVRLARTLRKASRPDSAIAVYRNLGELESVAVGGLPGGLIGRFGELSVLRELDRTDALREGAAALMRDLRSGRWKITRASYLFYEGQLTGWISSDEMDDSTGSRAPSDALALAEVVETLWSSWRAGDARLKRGGRQVLWSRERPVSVVWQTTPDRLVALLGGQHHLRQLLHGDLEQLLVQQRIKLALSDTDGRIALSQFENPPTQRAIRTSARTGLPWNLEVAPDDIQGDLAQFAERRRLMIAVMLLVTLVAAFGTYAVARAVNREAEAVRLQSDFVSAVSHEFRTPLTTMRQLTELLASGRVSDDERREAYYAVMLRESSRLQRLVEGLLDFGRMEAKAHEFRMESFSADVLVKDVVEEFKHELAGSGHRVSLNANAESSTVRGDREALGRALWNLLDNAVKYSPGNGKVSVETSQRDGHVVICVRDEGIGIPADEQESIFHKFVRGTKGRQYNVKGTGLGLAMVREIVHLHGGEVKVESMDGAGSRFSILLPSESTP